MGSIFKNITTSDIQAGGNNINDIGSSVSKFKDLHIGGTINPGGTLPLPNLTTIQRDALTPASGDIIYNTTTNAQEYYNGTSWGSPVLIGGSFIDVTNSGDNDTPPRVSFNKDRAGNAVQANDVLGVFNFFGQTDTGSVNTGVVASVANENFTSTAYGTSLVVTTTESGTSNTALRLLINDTVMQVNPPLSLVRDITQTQQTTPTAPLSSTDKLYFKNDDRLYTQDSTGLEQRLSTDTLNLDKLQLNTQTLDITSVSGLSALPSKHVGGILAPNGKIYFIPESQDFITVVDTRDLSTYTITGVPLLSQGFNGGCVTSSGFIYCIPRSATYVLIINTNNDTIDGTSITGLSANLNKYAGGSLAPNGKIYCTPLNATNILIINTNNNTTSLIDTASVPGGLAGSTKWESSVLAPNGLIYCIPFDATTVLVINPATDSADNTLITGLPVGGKCIGGCLSSNGRIYCCPFGTTTVFIIDPATNLVDSTSITGVSSSNAGCVLANDGKIYCAPYSSTSVLIIDPSDNSFNNTNITGVTGATKYNGANVDNLGRVYFSPVNATNVGIITTHGLQTVTPDRYSSRYYNKY